MVARSGLVVEDIFTVEQLMAESKKSRSAASVIFSFLGVAILFAAVVYFMRSDVRAAKSIETGYSSTAVRELLGEPTAVIKSIGDLNALFPPTISYRFRTLDGELIEIDTIQFQAADWFEYGSAGYMVIYENGAVTRVVWGGT